MRIVPHLVRVGSAVQIVDRMEADLWDVVASEEQANLIRVMEGNIGGGE